jgi:hypothetical protein
LFDANGFPGFRAQSGVRGVFGDPKVRIIALKSTLKKSGLRLLRSRSVRLV